jgi:Domain of unknown function (DUF4136)
VNRILASFALVCAASTCFALRVRVDYDHGRDFSRYKNYRWVRVPDAQLPDQLMQTRIERFVEEALAAKGLKRVEKGGDLLVGYQTMVSEQQQFVTFGDGGWGWGNGISTTTTQTIMTGTLIVDMVDAQHNKLVFRGVSTATVSSRPEKNTRSFQKGIREMFEKYPPRS